MNSKPFAVHYFLPVALMVCFSIALIAWAGQRQSHQQNRTEQRANDTTPKVKKEKKIRDLDDAIGELNDAEMKLNMDKVNAEIREAMKNINAEKLKMEL